LISQSRGLGDVYKRQYLWDQMVLNQSLPAELKAQDMSAKI
jgi:hypothetical protein